MFPLLPKDVVIKTVVPDNVRILVGPDADFFERNRRQLEILYPGKWIVIHNGAILFIEDTEEAVYRRARELNLKFGSYSMFYPYPDV